MFRCPGQDQRFWKPGDIFEVRCPRCGASVEFFKDEPKLKCRDCGHVVANPKIDLGCAEWCQYAEQCVGTLAERDATALRDRLIDEMKNVFAGDQKRIEHTLAVLDYAEQIQQAEGADPFLVKAAAVLHDIGIAEAERKYGSAAGEYQQMEGPPMAEAILKEYNSTACGTRIGSSTFRKYFGVGQNLSCKELSSEPSGRRKVAIWRTNCICNHNDA